MELHLAGFAAGAELAAALDLTGHWIGLAALAIFVLAYVLVALEELTGFRKSTAVTLAAGLIWLLLGVVYRLEGQPAIVGTALRNGLLEYAELLLFLLVAMTYVHTLEERRVFEALRARLAAARLTYRQLFWLTGALAFVLSPVADNLATALIMGSVVIAVGAGEPRFIPIACINVVVAANAGGAFSPFGDITTLMVWQKGKATFFEFFQLFAPSLVNWLVPAAIMWFAVPKGLPPARSETKVEMKSHAHSVMALFAVTIALAVGFHAALDLPPVFGMLVGLGLLQALSYFSERKARRKDDEELAIHPYEETARAEWDTLFFFFGVILCVGGLSLIGYLSEISQLLYGGLGPVAANTLVGALSAVLDNIPLMYAVLTMDPAMNLDNWLLITLTAGVGGSLLSIGSAAGVALMGTARGYYTFFAHLKWSWAIALGYIASIAVHLALT